MAKATRQWGRSIFRIHLTPEARKKLLAVSDDLGITGIHVASSIIHWFASQSSETQATILGLYPELLNKDPQMLLLESMKQEASKKK